jgi:uncharacterized repeat protein (TIGR01451 family)
MKNVFWIAMLITIIGIVAFGQTQNVVSIKYPGYVLAAPLVLEGYNDADLIPMVAGKIDSLPKKAVQSRFGILFRDDAKNLSGFTVMEVLDAATNKVIRKISLDEYFNGRDNDLKFMKDIALVDDEALPGGKKLEVSFWLQSSTTALKVKARLYGRVEGAMVQASNGFIISNNEPLTMLKPALLFRVITGVPIQIEASKKGKPKGFILTGSAIMIKPNQKEKILSFDIVGSTISFAKYVPQQLENIKSYYASKKATPSVIVVMESEKPKSAPGDTMTYTIYYHNIGTAPATDINLTGPVPAGTQYLEGSATAEVKDAIISYVRNEAISQAKGEVLSVKWEDKSRIEPGKERWVRYKVLVR